MKMNFTLYNVKYRLFALFFSLLLSTSALGQTVTLGTGTTVSTANSVGVDLGPVNKYYAYQRFQVVYTAAELIAAGAPSGGGVISSFGWNVAATPGTLSNYSVRMANTTATNSATDNTTTLTTVFPAANVTFANGFHMLTLGTPFNWDGTSNLLVDICEGSSAFATPYGTVYTYGTAANSSRFGRNDTAAQCAVATSIINAWKPQARFVFGSCVALPTALASNTITATTANISWTAASPTPASGYEYYYSTSNTAPVGTTIPSGSVGSGVTTASLSGLTANTTYYFWVRSKCDATNKSGWAGSANFTTPCNATPITATEGFNSAVIPACWKTQIAAVQTASKISFVTSGTNPTTTPYEGTNFVQYNSFSNSGGGSGSEERLISLPLSSIGTTSVDVEFYWKNNNGTYSTGTYLNEGVQVQYSTNGGTTWTNAGAFIPRHDGTLASGTSQWNLKTVTIPTAVGNSSSFLIAFKFHSEWGENLFLDKVTVKPTPSCQSIPTALGSNNVTLTTANITWTAASPVPGNGYEYYYSTSNTIPTSATSPSGSVGAGVTTASLTGLTANTTYYFWVRGNCNGTDKSNWSTVGSFFTGYCTPTSSNTSDYISNFTTTGALTNFSHTTTSISTGGYGNFTSTYNVSHYPNGVINFSETYVGGNHGFNIWVDWNNDLQFSASELVYSGTGGSTGFSGSFTVPAGTPLGNYRMRIRAQFGSTANPPACGNISFGEAKDYTLQVVAAPNYRVYTTATAPNNTINNSIDIYFEDFDGINNFYTNNQTEIWMHAGLQTATGTWQYQNPGQDLYNTSTLIKFTRVTAGVPNVYKATVKFSDHFCIPSGVTIQGVNLIFRNQYPLPPQSGGDYNNQTLDMFLDLGDAAVTAPNPPTLAATTNITQNAATINWTAPTTGAIHGYDYYYSTANTAPNAGTPASGSTAANVTTANLSGLSPSTTYYFWVRTKSCDGSSAWSVRGTFDTLCGTIAVFPYNQTFDGVIAPALPNCWTVQDANGDGSTWKTATTNPNSAPNALTYTYSSTNPADDWAFTPAYNMAVGKSYVVSFSYRVRSATYPEQLSVSYGSTNDGGSMTNLIADLGTISNTTYQSVSYTITPASTGVNYIGFHASSAANMYEIYIDDFSVAETTAPTCVPPSNVTAYNVGSTTASVSWTHATTLPSGGYDIYINTTGVTPNAGTAPSQNFPNTTSAIIFNNTLTASTKYYFWVRSNCGGSNSGWVPVVFTTTCTATIGAGSDPAGAYISLVSFRGALNQSPIDNPSTYSTNPRGYQDFSTLLTPRPQQAQGNGMNIYVEMSTSSFLKAWVDWNKDGVFSPNEAVYDKPVGQLSTTFGFVVPTTVAPGDYKIRLRSNLFASLGGHSDYTSCGVIDRSGETEDYIIRVVANCSAIVTSTTDGATCGGGPVMVSAVASGNPSQFRWYAAATGGSPLGTTTTGTWTTPSITTTTTYYVAAYNGCESLVRIPVKAIVKPTPEVTFTPATATSCGDSSIIAVSAAGSNEVDHFINEKFEGGGLGVFTRVTTTNGATIDNLTRWQNRTSVFKPAGEAWIPAIASGVSGNKFVMATSDVGVDASNNPYTTNNSLVSPAISTLTYTNLTIKFRMYYSRYGIAPTSDYVNVEASTDGSNWNVVRNIITSIGFGTNFETVTINPTELTAYENKASVQFRIRYYAGWGDGVAIDDIEFYGERPLTPSFTWTGTPVDIYSDAAATTVYNNQPIGTIYIKPSLDQLEAHTSFDMSAKATLANGCFATGSITVNNDNNVFNSTSNDWADEAGWKPSHTVPDISKCVIVRTPVVIKGDANFEAKNVTVLSTGSLTINDAPNDPTKSSSLKIQNELINKAGIAGVLVNSGGNLIQVNKDVVNAEDITVKRNAKLPADQYMYWSSPVTFIAGQNFKTIYPGTPNALYYNEGTAYFGNSSGANILARGLALKGTAAAGTNLTATFLGKPYNGDAAYTLAYSGPLYGYNLVGNPYPSNIDLMALYSNNSTKIETTIQFWDNTLNTETKQLGLNYTGDSYAKLNAASGIPTPASGTSKEPSRYAIVGQGFMVRARPAIQTATGAAKNLIFTNTTRTKEKGVFFNRGEASVNQGIYWLRMTTPRNIFNTIAVSYSNGATNGYEDFDSRQNGAADMFYSSADNEKLAIQGRQYPFVKNDVVPLGSKQFEAGIHKIELAKTEGIFTDGQKIYLKDKQTGIITDLTASSYTFTADAGESIGRFEIIYESETILATGGNAKQELQVYRDGNDFVVKAQSKKITMIEVYDAGGRLIYNITPNSTKGIVNAVQMNNGMYVLKIHQSGEVTTRKVLK